MSENKTHWRKCDKSDFLGSCDLEEIGAEVVATIREVKMENAKIRGSQKMARIAYFVENLKPMVLNVENSKILLKFTGSKYIEDWRNVLVKIYVKDNVKMAGETTEGLRFRTTQPKLEKEKITPESVKWQRAVDNLNSGDTTMEYIEKNYDISEEHKQLLLTITTQ